MAEGNACGQLPTYMYKAEYYVNILKTFLKVLETVLIHCYYM